MLELKGITKSYKPTKGVRTIALNNLSVAFQDKGLVFITGTSGSGKSTLLNILGMLDKPDSGSLLINGKDSKTFSEKEIDAYHNSEMGFVFQDFNLFEECDVYENIEYSILLQKKKATRLGVELLLAKVGAEGQIDKKVYELSAGNKQRVAIARALAKDPKVLLADEPTGNLDSKASNDIMKILKEISKEKLVIVVTHDMELARKYGNRIITLLDGDVASDTRPVKKKLPTTEMNLISSRIPFINTNKIALSFLRKKKVRLLLTTLLVSFSLMLFSLSNMLTTFDYEGIHSKLVNVKSDEVKIYHNFYNKKFYDSSSVINLNENQIAEIKEKTNVPLEKVSKVMEDNKYIGINYVEKGNNVAYYTLDNTINYFVECESYSKYNLYLGTYPIDNDEIMINRITADYLLRLGFVTENDENYYPSSYYDIINRKIKIGSGYVRVTAIIDNELKKYEILKNGATNEYEVDNVNIFNEFSKEYASLVNMIYVNSSFFNNKNFIENNTINKELYSMFLENDNNSKYLYGNVKTLDSETSNKIIINEEILNEISNNGFKKYVEDYFNNNFVEKNNELLKILANEYMNEHNIIDKSINLKIKDLYYNLFKEEVIDSLQIIGINLENSDIYVSTKNLEKYIQPNKNITYLQLSSNTQKNVEDLFSNFGSVMGKYIVKTKYTNTINTIKYDMDKVNKVAKYALIPFLVFTVLLLSHFINISIRSNKKQIGILKSLGAKKIDIGKIYILEGIIIGVASFVISLVFIEIVAYSSIFFANNFYGLSTKLITLDMNTVKYILLTVVGVVALSSIIPTYKIAKMNPIDAINKK